MKRIVIVAAAIVSASLTAAPSAGAKGYVRAIQMCGPSACAHVDGPRQAMQRLGMDILAGTGQKAASPPLLPYYRLRFRPSYEVPDSDTFYIPGAKVICTDRGCISVPSGLAPALHGAAASVGSFAPHISSVTVNDRPRPDRAGFAVLFNQRPGPLPSTAVWKSRHYSVIVELSGTTPWSLGGASWMAYYPRHHALSRDGRWFHASAEVDRLVRGRAAATGGGGHGWPVAAAAVVVLAAAAGAGRRLRRPRSG